MSYHILHILSDNVFLSKRRGMLLCKNKDTEEARELPLEDVRILVLAAKSIVLTDSLISSLLENNAVILHCNSKYMAAGITSPIERMIDPTAIYNQAQKGSPFSQELWANILNTKIRNQSMMLNIIGDESTYLNEQLESYRKDGKKLNESACARFYWQHFFKNLGQPDATRRNSPDHKINLMLNYSYAVLSAICQRSIVIHGLSPLFGIHHKPRYQADSFVYDVMEVIRPFIDATVYKYAYKTTQELGAEAVNDIEMSDWIKSARMIGEEMTVSHKGHRLKLVDAIDTYISSLAKAFKNLSIKSIWLPVLDETAIKIRQKELFQIE